MSATQPVAGLLLFPGMTQLDLTGPYEVIARLPGWRTEIVGKTIHPVKTDRGLVITPSIAFAEAPQFDLLIVPGGPGTDDAILFAVTQGDLLMLGDDGRIVGTENWRTALDRYLEHCRDNGLEPRDVTGRNA